MIHVYYEMHFGPFLQGGGSTSRTSFPQPGLDRGQAGPPAASFGELREAGRLRREGPPDFYCSVDRLVTCSSLTEEFYQAILELCKTHLKPGDFALDIGCGLGRMVAELASRGAAWVLGVDLSPRMVDEAAALLAIRGVVPVRLNLVSGRTIGAAIELPFAAEGCEFVAGDARCLPVADRTVDFVLCLNLVDRMEEPLRLVDECARVLRPGGTLLLSDPYDWEGRPQPGQDRPTDLAQWFQEPLWQRIDEIDGMPFLLRRSSRQIIVYANHCLVFRRL